MNLFKKMFVAIILVAALSAVPEKDAEAAIMAAICKAGSYPGMANPDPTVWCEASWQGGGTFANFIYSNIHVIHRGTGQTAGGFRSADISPPYAGELEDAVISCNNTAGTVLIWTITNLWHWIQEPFSFTQVGPNLLKEKEDFVADSGHSSCNPRF